MKTLTTISAEARTAPTQELRNLIEDSRYGLADSHDLHNALLKLEVALGLSLTTFIENAE